MCEYRRPWSLAICIMYKVAGPGMSCIAGVEGFFFTNRCIFGGVIFVTRQPGRRRGIVG